MRYLWIDLARSVAIILVFRGPSLMAANVQEGDGVSPLRFSLAVSPTVFFCLLVVCCSWSVPGSTSPGASVQRLLTRAVECLALYVLTCATMCLAAGLPFTYFICWTMFLGGTP
jgi:hypothetical protein